LFNFICGTAVEKTDGALIVENNGVGYEIFVSANTLFSVAQNARIQLYTYFQVKEDGVALFGFLSREEKAMFLKLINVGGVGPKLAMTVLSGISARDLALSILHGDVSALTRVKGVGKKTAERIILELKEKVDGDVGGLSGVAAAAGGQSGAAADAVMALAALGFGKAEAAGLVKEIFAPGMTAEELITKALRKQS
jgi:Holliday junction DNA helicase RuvA